MSWIAHRLVLVDVDRRHAGTPGVQRRDQGTGLDQLRSAGVHEQGRWLHAPESAVVTMPSGRLD